MAQDDAAEAEAEVPDDPDEPAAPDEPVDPDDPADPDEPDDPEPLPEPDELLAPAFSFDPPERPVAPEPARESVR